MALVIMIVLFHVMILAVTHNHPIPNQLAAVVASTRKVLRVFHANLLLSMLQGVSVLKDVNLAHHSVDDTTVPNPVE